MAGLYKKKQKKQRQTEEDIDYSAPDFSKSAVQKAVKKASVQRAGVLYPFAIGILGGLAALVLGPSTLLIGAAVVGGVLGIGSLFFNLTLGKEKFTARYLKKLQRRLAKQTSRSIKQLGLELGKVNQYHGLKQLDLLQRKYNAFKAILNNKFNVSEISHSRYMGMVEQVFLAALDNLKQVANITQAINVIDENHIIQRIQTLKKGPVSAAGQQEHDALVNRFKLLQSQRDKVTTVLSQNESAMTKMDEIMAAVSIIDTSKKQATMRIEDAMKELEDLAARAHKYSVD